MEEEKSRRRNFRKGEREEIENEKKKKSGRETR